VGSTSLGRPAVPQKRLKRAGPGWSVRNPLIRRKIVNAPTIPGYLIASLRVKNLEEYMQRYGMPAIAQLKEIGAEIEVASAEAAVLEGEWDCNWTVVIRFPSKEIATEYYNSPRYTPLRTLRINELTDSGSVVLVEGFDPPALG
jgi:uncharacterized protein (DUF1330 family)